jgi:hypothetical protein
MAAFQFYLQSGRQKSRVGGEWHSHCFWSKIPWSKRKCETVCCHDAIASSSVSKVRSELFAYFHTFAINVTVACGIDCLSCQDEFFVINLHDVKRMMTSSWLRSTFSLGMVAALFQDHNYNLAPFTSDNPGQKSCIVGGDLLKFLADVGTLLLLIISQKSNQTMYTTANERT